MKIRLSHTDSINSINKENFVEVELKNTSKLSPYNDIKSDVDSYEVFENERNRCNNYRLILTINPFCTNILFNTLTEIVKDEGSEDVVSIRDNNTTSTISSAYGTQRPNRVKMLMNTEYSRDSIGYKYLPGYDIFNNHIIRNKAFKVVNRMDSTLNRDIFNTIEDYSRYMDGSVIEMGKRFNIEDAPEIIDKHLYLYDEIMSLEDSFNENLAEENGWFGFINKSNVPSKEDSGRDNAAKYSIYNDLGISKVLNNHENCEFIDMYPNRELFSFNPQLNSFRKRIEYNWDVILTYPYRNEYCYNLVTSEDGKTNGLKIMSVKKTISTNGAQILMFRSYIKHGLTRGDMFRLYVNGTSLDRLIKVTNTGNLSETNDNNAQYFFYTTDTSLLTHLGMTFNTLSNKWENKNGNEVDVDEELRRINDVRICHVINNIDVEYYIRVFRKVPNLKNKKEVLTDEIAIDNSKFEDYIYGTLKNASYEDEDGESYMLDFNKEQYRLAFARTIYNDASTQVTFTDTINVEHLVDNLNRPLHEIYATIIKTNRGYNEWYGLTHDKNNNKYTYNENDIDLKSDNIEFSHCFGNVSSGVEFMREETDKFDDRLMMNNASLSDLSLINELEVYNAVPLESEITYKKGIDKDEFYGDIVEYSPSECIEKTLEVISHRFNTAQREMPDNTILNNFNHNEISHDDLDREDFSITSDNEVGLQHISYDNNPQHQYNCMQRPEGYFYHPHYQILLKEFGRLNQSAHYDMKIRSIKPVQTDGIYLSVTTTLSHGLFPEDIVYLCLDDTKNYKNDKWYKFAVSYTENKLTFLMHPYNKTWRELYSEIARDTGTAATSWNWLKIAEMIQSGNIYKDNSEKEITYNVKLRRRNINIPIYASKINHNKFLWRDMYRRGEFMDSTYEEYPYTNDAFYVNKEINFFLKRQDPHGYSGLYCDTAFPNDVEGNKRPSDNYFYKEEDEVVC